MSIHFIDGEKGGVGKSWFAFCMTEYLISKLIPLYLYAADTSNPTATSKYKDKERYAEFYDDSIHYTVFSENEKKLDEPDAILEMALQRTVVIDLPAQVHNPITNWIDQKEIFTLSKQSGIEWVRWFVCNGRNDSLNLLVDSADFYKHQQTVVVKNWGLCENWDLFNEREDLQAVIKKYKMQVIDFPKLPDSKAIKMDANNWTFDEAIELGKFGMVGNSDIYRYVQKVYQMFEDTQLLEALTDGN
jgi:hypothetical protein